MDNRMLDCVTLPAPSNTRATVIWLHGLGADGNDFVPIVPELGLGDAHGVKFLFPNAPHQPVTLNGGMHMPAWYDIQGTDIADKQDRAGIEASAARIEALIAQEIANGIPASRIVLAGFSQGGAVALHTALRHGAPLAGLMALSTYLPLHDSLTSEASPANRAIPIFMAHGNQDPMVPFELGQASCRILQQNGYAVDWHEYPMAHEVCQPEVETIGHWLQARLASVDD